MANYIKDTVLVNVVYGGRAISVAGFGTPLFVSNHNIFTTRQVAYTAASELLDAGFATNSPAYSFAQGVFSGKQAPATLIVGRAVPSAYTVQVDVSSVTDDVLSVYSKIDGTAETAEYTVLVTDTTPQLLGDGLATQIALVAGVATAVSDANGLITVTLDDGTKPTSFGVAQNTTIYTSTAESVVDVLAEIEDEFSDFAILSGESHEIADQELYAGYAESNDILYVYSSQDENAYDPLETSDIFYKLAAFSYQYSCGLYSTVADSKFSEGALVGTFAAASPASNFTLNLQELAGIPYDTISASKQIALTAKNANFYIQEYGFGSVHHGWVANSSYLDMSRFGLWLKTRGQESMYSTMQNFASQSSALSYSDAGIAIVRSRLYTDVINVGIAGGTILTGFGDDAAGNTINYNPIVNTSTRASQTNSAIGQRLWEGFTIECVYAGSIHHINSKAYVVTNRVAG